MRVLQLIDSLEAGGAERMAASYANALSAEIEFSGLTATRKEGALLDKINENVSYLFLRKKHAFDLRALFQLRSFVIQNKVNIIHAHSTSFLFAFLLKLTRPSLQLIWHDHYGDSEFLEKRPRFMLKVTIPFFSGIIAVNQKLKDWSERVLNFKNVIYLPNFSSMENEAQADTILKGKNGKRIVSLANLRFQKDHFLLLEVAMRLKKSHPEWTFHLIGKDFEDRYSQKIRERISESNLGDHVFIYGTRTDVKNILNQAAIAILTSQSEGLPVALLEYGNSKKPVVVTNVGEIGALVKDNVNGFLIEAHKMELFYNALVKLIENPTLQTDFGNELYKTIVENNSEETIIKKYLNWLRNSKK